jgi:SAM-dependent methyltransferase
LAFNATTPKYSSLYSRWLSNPGALLDFASFDPSQSLLDLCGGTGAVSLEALRRNASRPTLVDLSPRCTDTRVFQVKGDVHNPSTFENLSQFDLCVIRQSIGYLNPVKLSPVLASVIKPGGKLVFNTFIKPRWKFSSYTFENKRFFEASGHVSNFVFHLQSNFLNADISIFRHHTVSCLVSSFQHFTPLSIQISNRSVHFLFRR